MDSVDPRTGSFGGGTRITITGRGMYIPSNPVVVLQYNMLANPTLLFTSLVDIVSLI